MSAVITDEDRAAAVKLLRDHFGYEDFESPTAETVGPVARAIAAARERGEKVGAERERRELRKWLAYTLRYYKRNKHAREWLPFVGAAIRSRSSR